MKPQGERLMTEFLARELLYQYVIGQLEAEDRLAVEKYLTSSESLKTQLEQLKRALGYMSVMSESLVSEELIQTLTNQDTLKDRLTRQLDPRRWPKTLRYSLEGAFAGLIVFIAILSIPWQSVFLTNDEPYTLSEIAIDKVSPRVEDGKTEGELENTNGESTDPQLAQVESPPNQEIVEASSESLAESTNRVPEKFEQKLEPSVTVVESAQPKVDTQAVAQGFVYRLYMFLRETDTLAPMMVKDLEGFGAIKAGQVPLGWKQKNGRYFHFTVDGSKEQQLLDKLRTYGTVRLKKDPHPRVMPEGTLRYILWVEEEE